MIKNFHSGPFSYCYSCRMDVQTSTSPYKAKVHSLLSVSGCVISAAHSIVPWPSVRNHSWFNGTEVKRRVLRVPALVFHTPTVWVNSCPASFTAYYLQRATSKYVPLVWQVNQPLALAGSARHLRRMNPAHKTPAQSDFLWLLMLPLCTVADVKPQRSITSRTILSRHSIWPFWFYFFECLAPKDRG